MATDFENTLRTAAAKVGAYIDNVATLTVETKYVVLGPNGDVDFTQAKPVARTVIKLDGDSEAVLPLRASAAGALAVDADLLDLHQRNVSAAIEYRAKLVESLIGMLKSVER